MSSRNFEKRKKEYNHPPSLKLWRPGGGHAPKKNGGLGRQCDCELIHLPHEAARGLLLGERFTHCRTLPPAGRAGRGARHKAGEPDKLAGAASPPVPHGKQTRNGNTRPHSPEGMATAVLGGSVYSSSSYAELLGRPHEYLAGRPTYS
jgi:hypothetical protein